MATLNEVLKQLREKIRRYAGKPMNEQNTKAMLVDPVLRALGWDPEDVEEVHREFKVKPADKPVDYALLVLRQPRLIVEAKALGVTLDDRRWANQMMGYAAVAGAPWVALTDGNEWRVFNAHVALPVDERVFRKVKVSDDGAFAEETLGLLSKRELAENRIEALWKVHHVDRTVRKAIERTFAERDAGLVAAVTKRSAGLSRDDVKASLTRVRVHLDFPVVDVKAVRAKPVRRDVTLKDLIDAGVLRAPLEVEKTYMGTRLTARIEPDGTVSFAGKTYESLSTAAGMARLSVRGPTRGRPYPQTNGWTFWCFKDGTGKLVPVEALRRAARARRGDASPDRLRLVRR